MVTRISGSSAQIYRLQTYEEAVGVLKDILLLDGYALAEIGPVIVALPVEMGERLNAFIGQRIGVMRTDHDYRFRAIMQRSDLGSNPLIIAQ